MTAKAACSGPASRSVFLTILFCLTSLICNAAWQVRSPLAGSGALTAVTYGDGQFIAVSSDGDIIGSADGTNWTRRFFVPPPAVPVVMPPLYPPNYTLNDVAYGDGVFIAVGARGRIVVSSNGFDWRIIPHPTNAHLYNVAYGNNRWVASELITFMEVSTNQGSTWTQSIPQPTSPQLSLAYGAGQFVAGGTSGRFSYSVSGGTWHDISTASSGMFSSLTFAQERFVALTSSGQSAVSTDGLGWTLSIDGVLSNAPVAITYGHGVYIGVNGDGSVSTSTNGLDWNYAPASVAFPDGILAAASSGTQTVLVGSNALIAVGSSATDYTVVSYNFPAGGGNVAYGKGIYVQAGRNFSTRSRDATNWTSIAGLAAVPLSAITFAQNKWVAVSSNGAAFTSDDATNWQSQVLSGSGEMLHDIAYGTDRYVAVGEAVFISNDGTNWTRTVTYGPGSGFAKLAFRDGLFAATGNGLFTSPDGVTWTQRTNDTVASFCPITAFPDGFLVANSNGVFRSSDGMQWSQQPTTGLPLGQAYRDLNWGRGFFVLVGERGLVASSRDGRQWIVEPPLTSVLLTGVGFGNGRFIAAGERRYILDSGKVEPQIVDARTDSGNFRARVYTEAGYLTRVDFTTDFTAWSPLTNFVPATNVYFVIDGLGANYRFYRAVAP